MPLEEAVETACAALAVNVLKGNVGQVEALMVARTLCGPCARRCRQLSIRGFIGCGACQGAQIHDAA